MKLRRLFQPRNPQFWLMLVLNGLSTVLAWVARHMDLSWPAATAVGVFALGNAVLGLLLMRNLMTTPEGE